MTIKTCKSCGKEFSVRNYRSDTAKFCSRACRGRWNLKNRVMPNEHKIGNKFRAGKRPTNAFTSEQVSGSNNPRWQEGVELECKICGSKFRMKPWLLRQNGPQKYCSKECRKIGRIGSNNPRWVGGQTTYRGKGWLLARKLAVIRDSGTCQSCGKFIGESIPVHHIKPFRNIKSEEQANKLENLICLCQSCHVKAEWQIIKSSHDQDSCKE